MRRVHIKKDPSTNKIGMFEIKGLEKAMQEIVKPIQDLIREKAYWDREVSFEPSEYKSRDGFIPYESNCGGLNLTIFIPDCEKYDWDFLDFGEWDGTHYCDETDTDNCECPYANDGEYDAKLRVWFKFEGYDQETGELSFYLYAGGGNGDAPYFRTKYEHDVFEASFTCKSIDGIKRAASKHVKALLKVMGDKK